MAEIKRVSKGKTQDRITIPKEWKADYVVVEALKSKVKMRGIK